jgi:hypothetical protein
MDKLFDDPEDLDPDLMEDVTDEEIEDLAGEEDLSHLGFDTSNVDGD